MTETREKMTKIIFEEEPCGRCGGTGQHSYNQRDGHVCWGCSGKKTRLSRRGRTAFQAYEKALAESAATVAVQDVKPGMRIMAQAHGGVVNGNQPWDYKPAWRTVAEVKVTEYTGRGVEDGKIIDVPCVRAELKFEDGKAWTAESSDHPAYWAKGAYHTIYTIRAFAVGGEEARAARDEVRRAIAARFTGAWLEGEEPPARPVRKPRPAKKTEEKVTEPKPAPKPLPANRYAGECHKCTGQVDAMAGELLKLDGRWAVQHKEGECPAPAQEEQGGAQEAQRTATVDDVVKRLTGTSYEWTMVHAMGWGMGAAQLGIEEAVKAAESAGLVITDLRGGKLAARLADRTQEPPARPAMPNKFPGECAYCGVRVEAGKGERVRVEGEWCARHPKGECPEPPGPAADGTPGILITRSKLYPEVARPGPAWRWSYDYRVNGGPVCQYGPGLDSLRDMLRRKYGRGARIEEGWKPQTPAEKEA